MLQLTISRDRIEEFTQRKKSLDVEVTNYEIKRFKRTGSNLSRGNDRAKLF